jgi:hypothetical protein
MRIASACNGDLYGITKNAPRDVAFRIGASGAIRITEVLVESLATKTSFGFLPPPLTESTIIVWIRAVRS